MRFSFPMLWNNKIPEAKDSSFILSYLPIKQWSKSNLKGVTTSLTIDYNTQGHILSAFQGHSKSYFKYNRNTYQMERLIFLRKQLIERQNFIFNEEGQIRKIYTFGGADHKLLHLYSYEYDSYGKLHSQNRYLANGPHHTQQYHYYWEKDNIKAIVYRNESQNILRENTYELDLSNNPLRNHPLFLHSPRGWNKNNILRLNQKTKINGRSQPDVTYNYQIKFNALGLPTEILKEDSSTTKLEYILNNIEKIT